MVRRASDDGERGPLTVSRLARAFGLSRSTLLYYDRLGLLASNHRSPAGYRLYGRDARARLARIVELRAAGLPLATVKQVLDQSTPLVDALARQAAALHRQLAELHARQRLLSALLRHAGGERRVRGMTKAAWTRMFRAIGMDAIRMRGWHARFERTHPDAHEAFLESLGLDPAEVRRIRDWALRPHAGRTNVAR